MLNKIQEVRSERRHNTRDFSQVSGNATSWIQENYKQLMSIQDPNELADFFLQGVKQCMSPAKYSETEKIINGDPRRPQIAGKRDDLEALQFYITRFNLAGSGMAAIENAQYAIASMITEDCESIKLTRYQIALKRLVETYSHFKVVLLS